MTSIDLKTFQCCIITMADPWLPPFFSEIVHFLCISVIIFTEFNIHSQAFKSPLPLAEGLDPPLTYQLGDSGCCLNFKEEVISVTLRNIV